MLSLQFSLETFIQTKLLGVSVWNAAHCMLYTHGGGVILSSFSSRFLKEIAKWIMTESEVFSWKYFHYNWMILITTHASQQLDSSKLFKGCGHYIFTSLFCKSKREDLWNKEKYFLFHFGSSFRSWDNQILNFQIFKCHDVIKCLSMKHETRFIE